MVVVGWVVVGWCVGGDHIALLGRRELADALSAKLIRDGGRVVAVVVVVVEVGTDERTRRYFDRSIRIALADRWVTMLPSS